MDWKHIVYTYAPYIELTLASASAKALLTMMGARAVNRPFWVYLGSAGALIAMLFLTVYAFWQPFLGMPMDRLPSVEGTLGVPIFILASMLPNSMTTLIALFAAWGWLLLAVVGLHRRSTGLLVVSSLLSFYAILLVSYKVVGTIIETKWLILMSFVFLAVSVEYTLRAMKRKETK